METGIPFVNIVAWCAVVACIVATVLCATTQARRHVRLFTSLTFFALSWAVLLPYYGLQAEKEQSKGLSEVIELLPAYSGFLLTLAGGPLRREAAVRRSHRDPGIGRHDTWVLHALYLIVVPHVIAVPGASGFLLQYHGQIVMVLGTAFTVLGFFSILQGLGELTRGESRDHRIWWFLTGVTCLYIVLELAYTAFLLPNPEQDMPPSFKWAYAAFKTAFSGLFLFLLVRQTRPRSSPGSQTGGAANQSGEG